MRTPRLTRDGWMQAARLALLESGPDAVRVEPLAATLGVTKGSFYWHFTDRQALLDALVSEWEAERDLLVHRLTAERGPAALRQVIAFTESRIGAGDRGEIPSDTAMFAWAAMDPAVGERVNAAEAERIALVQRVVGDPELGEFLYLAYLGFMMRRRRVPEATAFFGPMTRIAERLVRESERRKPSTAGKGQGSKRATSGDLRRQP
jgi:AcrR family transcriptional regulator